MLTTRREHFVVRLSLAFVVQKVLEYVVRECIMEA